MAYEGENAPLSRIAYTDPSTGQAVPLTSTTGQPISTVKGNKTASLSAPTGVATLVLAANAVRKSAWIFNAGAVDVYLRESNAVTTVNGVPLRAGATLFDDATKDAWWGITAGATADLRVLEIV